MASYWSLEDIQVEIDVDDPGNGWLVLVIWQPGSEPAREVSLRGRQLGDFLADVTALALGGELPERRRPVGAPGDRERRLPSWLTATSARRLLPALQSAVLLAAAGTDRYERTVADVDEPPEPPFCATCGEGSPYAAVPTTSTWCAEHGHTPYGYGRHTTWETAQKLSQREREWFDRWATYRSLDGTLP